MWVDTTFTAPLRKHVAQYLTKDGFNTTDLKMKKNKYDRKFGNQRQQLGGS